MKRYYIKSSENLIVIHFSVICQDGDYVGPFTTTLSSTSSHDVDKALEKWSKKHWKSYYADIDDVTVMTKDEYDTEIDRMQKTGMLW